MQSYLKKYGLGWLVNWFDDEDDDDDDYYDAYDKYDTGDYEENRPLMSARKTNALPKNQKSNKSFKKYFKYLIIFIVGWLVGYFITWKYRSYATTAYSNESKPSNTVSFEQKIEIKSYNNNEKIKKIDMSKLDASRKLANEVIMNLWKYYEPKSHYMLNRAFMFGFGNEHDTDQQGPDAAPHNQENFQYISNRLASSLISGGSFIIGGIGSSVMCGHDNCAEDAYPRIMEAMMKPVFDAAGVKFEWRNAAETGECGDSFQNQVFCFRNLVGDDIDILHYEWTYFGTYGAYHELILRWALALPKAPPLFIYNTGGYKPSMVPSEPDDFTDFIPAVLTQESSKEDIDIFARVYAKYGFNAYLQERHLSLNGKFLGKIWGQEGDGLHNTTRKGESLFNMINNENFEDVMDEVHSQGVVFRNWHPGPLGLQAVADAFTYLYLRAFINAIDRIKQYQESDESIESLQKRFMKKDPAMEKDFQRNRPHPVHKLTPINVMGEDAQAYRLNINRDYFYSSGAFNPDSSLINNYKGNGVEAVLLAHILNTNSLSELPGCLTFEKPTFGRSQIGIENADSPFNPYSDSIESNHYMPWEIIEGERTELMPAKDKSRPECAQPDRCGAIVSKGADNGWLVLRLPKITLGYVILCFAPLGCRNTRSDFQKSFADYDFEFDGKSVNPTKIFWSFGKKCVIIQRAFEGPVEDKTGHLFLGIRNRSQSCMSLSQIISG